jgi:hypothetical protein
MKVKQSLLDERLDDLTVALAEQSGKVQHAVAGIAPKAPQKLSDRFAAHKGIRLTEEVPQLWVGELRQLLLELLALWGELANGFDEGLIGHEAPCETQKNFDLRVAQAALAQDLFYLSAGRWGSFMIRQRERIVGKIVVL